MPTGIFRITHIQNLSFILRNGLHCRNSKVQDPAFVSIGYSTLIANRDQKPVPIAPGGTLRDYVPFYFLHSPVMLYIIRRGNKSEIPKTRQEDIVYLVSTIEQLEKLSCQYIFTDRHALLEQAEYFKDRKFLSSLQWDIIKSRDFGLQYGKERRELKQAECLVHRQVPIEALVGIACKTQEAQEAIQTELLTSRLKIEVKVKPDWYF